MTTRFPVIAKLHENGKRVGGPVPLDGQPLICPFCEYDLTGLAEPRCPECGRIFDPEELADPSRRSLPGLFEHSVHHRVRDFFRTQWRAWRPYRFWSSVRPVHRLVPRRLMVYALVAPTLFVMLFALPVVGLVAAQTHAFFLSIRARVGPQSTVYVRGTSAPLAELTVRLGLNREQILDEVFPPPGDPLFWEFVADHLTRPRATLYRFGLSEKLYLPYLSLVVGPLVAACVPLSSMMVLLTMRWSLARRQAGWLHVSRVCCYSTDLLPYVTLCVALSCWHLLPYARGLKPGPPLDNTLFLLTGQLYDAALLTSLVSLVRLHAALRKYLIFQNASGVTLTVAVVAIGLALCLWP